MSVVDGVFVPSELSRVGSVPNTPLPPGWSMKIEQKLKRPYYLNHSTQTTSWTDPRPMPGGWSSKTDSKRNKMYYLCHSNRSTTWTDPRPFPPLPLPSSSENKDDRPVPMPSPASPSGGLRRKKSNIVFSRPVDGYGPAVPAASEEKKENKEKQLRSSSVSSASSASPAYSSRSSSVSSVSSPSPRRASTPKEFVNAAEVTAQLIAMGFGESQIKAELKSGDTRSLEQIMDALMGTPQPLARQDSSEDHEMLRTVLIADKHNGALLTRQQNNFVLLTDHKSNSSYECTVCYCDYTIDEICVSSCGHFLCEGCMEQYIITAIGSMKASSIICANPECNEMISHSEVKMFVKEDEYTRYERLLMQDALKLMKDCRWCPKPGCGTAMIGHADNPMMRCPNEKCRYCFCYNCKDEWHSDVTCVQYQAWKRENGEGEDRFAKWLSQNAKECGQCQAPIQKNEGCNHMKCINCKHEFCWLCMQSVLGPDGKYKSGHWALFENSPCHGKMHT